MFISRSEAFRFTVGEVISLPCEVTQPGLYFKINNFMGVVSSDGLVTQVQINRSFLPKHNTLH